MAAMLTRVLKMMRGIAKTTMRVPVRRDLELHAACRMFPRAKRNEWRHAHSVAPSVHAHALSLGSTSQPHASRRTEVG